MRRAVERAGDRNWMAVAREVNMALGHAPGGGRTAKQCRGRYMHHLKPGLKRGPWAWDEEDALVAAHKRYGNSWSKVARHLPGRTETDIKNHCEQRRPSSLPPPPACLAAGLSLAFSLHFTASPPCSLSLSHDYFITTPRAGNCTLRKKMPWNAAQRTPLQRYQLSHGFTTGKMALSAATAGSAQGGGGGGASHLAGLARAQSTTNGTFPPSSGGEDDGDAAALSPGPGGGRGEGGAAGLAYGGGVLAGIAGDGPCYPAEVLLAAQDAAAALLATPAGAALDYESAALVLHGGGHPFEVALTALFVQRQHLAAMVGDSSGDDDEMMGDTGGAGSSGDDDGGDDGDGDSSARDSGAADAGDAASPNKAAARRDERGGRAAGRGRGGRVSGEDLSAAAAAAAAAAALATMSSAPSRHATTAAAAIAAMSGGALASLPAHLRPDLAAAAAMPVAQARTAVAPVLAALTAAAAAPRDALRLIAAALNGVADAAEPEGAAADEGAAGARLVLDQLRASLQPHAGQPTAHGAAGALLAAERPALVLPTAAAAAAASDAKAVSGAEVRAAMAAAMMGGDSDSDEGEDGSQEQQQQQQEQKQQEQKQEQKKPVDVSGSASGSVTPANDLLRVASVGNTAAEAPVAAA